MKLPFVFSLALVAMACSGPPTVPMINAPQTPAAAGWVTTHVAENGNLRLTVEVKHMAPPERVSPGAKVYVVWVQPQNAQPQNVGALRLDDDRRGRLETLTAFPSFEIYVTAEEMPAATMPRGIRVLTAVVAR